MSSPIKKKQRSVSSGARWAQTSAPNVQDLDAYAMPEYDRNNWWSSGPLPGGGNDLQDSRAASATRYGMETASSRAEVSRPGS